MNIELTGRVAKLIQDTADAMGQTPQEIVERVIEERLHPNPSDADAIREADKLWNTLEKIF